MDRSQQDRPVEVVTPDMDMSRFAKFWPTVIVIELTDVAFAVDSILAALGVHPAEPETRTRQPEAVGRAARRVHRRGADAGGGGAVHQAARPLPAL
jgi:hypothetical protein